MKTQDKNTNRSQTLWASIFFFWFLVVGTPAAFCSAVPVDVLWAGLFDNSGQPLEAGKVYFYTAGTTASKAVYIDSGKVTPAANPVVLDAYGRAAVYADGSYKIVVKTTDDVTLITVDNLEYLSTSNPTTQAVTNFSATNATIASATISQGTMTNQTISSATITLANLISPSIANASMTGILHTVNIVNATFTGVLNFASATTNIATPTKATDPANKGYVDNCATPTLDTQPANAGYVKEIVADAVAPSVYCPVISTFTASTYAYTNITLTADLTAQAQITDSTYTIGNTGSHTKQIIGRIQFTTTIASDTIYTFAAKDDSGNIYDMVRTRLPSGIAAGCEIPISLQFGATISSGTTKVFSVYASSDKAGTISVHHKGSSLGAAWQTLSFSLDY